MAPAEESPPLPAFVCFPDGTGEININNRTIDDYFGLETLKMVVPSARVDATDTEGKFDVVCYREPAAAFTGQAGAIRHGISSRPAAG